MFHREQRIAEVARVVPGAIAVFEEAEIDFSCKGAQSLADAASESGYRVEDVLERLASVRPHPGESDWFTQPLSILMSNLMEDHSRTIAWRIPAVRDAIQAAPDTAETRRITVLFSQLAASMTTHVRKEERELFPYIRGLEQHASGGSAPVMRIAQGVLRE